MKPAFDNVAVKALREVSPRHELIAAMEQFYRELDQDIAARRPICWNSGECCRFGQYGHRLYVTALEVAYYLAKAQSTDSHSLPPANHVSLPVLGSSSNDDTCPHANGGCQARQRRPMGCRIFYCDPAAQDW